LRAFGLAAAVILRAALAASDFMLFVLAPMACSNLPAILSRKRESKKKQYPPAAGCRSEAFDDHL
jgi:hypothetical protein